MRLLLATFLLCAGCATAQIPERSALYRIDLTRQAQARFGIDAPVARFAAQIHQESSWRPDAKSRFADGLAQFTARTGRWITSVCAEVGEYDPLDPDWSIRAMICFDDWIYDRQRKRWADECSAWAGTLSEYNGGGKALRNETRMAQASTRHRADIWFGQVEMMKARADWAYKENRHYPRRILLDLERRYIQAGWPGEPVCE